MWCWLVTAYQYGYACGYATICFLQRVEAEEASPTRDIDGPLEHHPMYALLVECNALLAKMDDEVERLINEARDKYAPRFKDLESIVPNALGASPVCSSSVGLCTDVQCA
jgi:hypothetical protein